MAFDPSKVSIYGSDDGTTQRLIKTNSAGYLQIYVANNPIVYIQGSTLPSGYTPVAVADTYPVIIGGHDYTNTVSTLRVNSLGQIQAEIVSAIDISDDYTRQLGRVVLVDSGGVVLSTSPDVGRGLLTAPGYNAASGFSTSLAVDIDGKIILGAGTSLIGAVTVGESAGDPLPISLDPDGVVYASLLSIANDYARQLGRVKIIGDPSGSLLDVYSPHNTSGGEVAVMVCGYTTGDEEITTLEFDTTTHALRVTQIGTVTVSGTVDLADDYTRQLGTVDLYRNTADAGAGSGLSFFGTPVMAGFVTGVGPGNIKINASGHLYNLITDGTDTVDIMKYGDAFTTSSPGVPVFGRYVSGAGVARPLTLDSSNRLLCYVTIGSGTVTAVTDITNPIALKDADAQQLTFAQENYKAWDNRRYSIMSMGVYDDGLGTLAPFALRMDDKANLLVVVDGGSLAVTTDIVQTEDAVHASGHKGVMSLAIRQDSYTAAVLAGTVGDYIPLLTDKSGNLRIAGSCAEDDAFNAGDSGVRAMAVRRDTPVGGASVDADGDCAPLIVNNAGSLLTNGGFYFNSGKLTNASYSSTVDFMCNHWSVQVVKGTSTTTWTVELEGSNDGTNFEGLSLSHTNASPGNLKHVDSTTSKLRRYWRVKCAACDHADGVTVHVSGAQL